MPYYPEDQSRDNLDKIVRDNVCAECGGRLYIYGAKYDEPKYIACRHLEHEGIAKEYLSKTNREEFIRSMNMTENSVALEVQKRNLPMTGRLQKEEALEILRLVYPNVPADEINRTAILCKDFGLHPLLKEVYIIPFKIKRGDQKYETQWSTVLGIDATRKMYARFGSFSYIDDTPRVMTEEEQVRIFGEVDKKNIVAITRLKSKAGLTAPGYGRWPKDKEPYGTDKGNTKANMAFIRSERNAFGRLYPDNAIPEEVEVMDDRYIRTESGTVDTTTGEIQEEPAEGEYEEVAEEEAAEEANEPLPEATKSKSTRTKASPGVIDRGWLIDSLNTIANAGQKWSVSDYIEEQFVVTVSATGSLIDCVNSLSKKQQEQLVAEVQRRLDDINK